MKNLFTFIHDYFCLFSRAHQKKKENFMMKKRKANMKNAPKKSQEKFNMKMNRGGNKGKGGKKGGMGKGRKK
jgi:hypothetical protein